ncbi:MAG: PE family protein, partial [Deltaproteobacteria bacterium]
SGIDARDWEDMGSGPCPDGGSCLFFGDIGDNGASHESIVLYRVPEPEVPETGEAADIDLTGFDAFEARYPDRPHNAEALIVDPATGIPYILTKEQEGAAQVFRFPERPSPSPESVMLLHVGELPPEIRIVTGADVSPDGLRLLVRTYVGIHEFTRTPSEPFEALFSASPCAIDPAAEPQGEAISYAEGDEAIYTISEGPFPPIHRASCAR